MRVGVGACTVGKPVRYNGEAKSKNAFLQQLSEHLTLLPFCPEVGIGLGVPRQTIRLVEGDQKPRAMDSDSHSKDYTQRLEAFAEQTLEDHPDLAGYILVKGSPSCGFERLKVYKQDGDLLGRTGVGVFTRRIQELNPLLPVEEDGRLNDARLRESFVSRVYVYQAWLELRDSRLSAHKLIQFYAGYKYLVMAHDINAYQAVGRLLADAGKRDVDDLGLEMMQLILGALKKPATRKGFTNAMQHIRGYLKRDLASDEKQDIDQAIEQYRLGIVPLVVPMKLLQYQFNRHPNEYIAEQLIMQPYPEALGLRNAI